MSTAEIGSILLTFGAGFGSAVFSEPLRRWVFRPTLRISFDALPNCNVRTADNTTILRLRVGNTSRRPAFKCQVYLLNVEMPHASLKPPVLMDEARRLNWAFVGDTTDLYGRMTQYVDLAIVYADKRLNFAAGLPTRIDRMHDAAAHFLCRVAIVSEQGSYFECSFQLVRNHPTGDFVFVSGTKV